MNGLTRIAPTPSGYLHLGNLVNFRFVDLVAQALNLDILLRIDDADAGRRREQYADDIFRVLEFLQIAPQQFSQTQLQRTEIYWQALIGMREQGAPLFVCSCSRAQMPNRVCERGCAKEFNSFVAGEDCIRFRFTGEDVTLWGREHPSYHLVSCVDDRDYGVTHVVRGEDLAPSTRIHEALNNYLGNTVHYAHHDVLLNEHGQKLSKSHGTNRLNLTPELRQTVDTHAHRLISRVLDQLT